jgi:outer membrane lipoprotein-sorting protein
MTVRRATPWPLLALSLPLAVSAGAATPTAVAPGATPNAAVVAPVLPTGAKVMERFVQAVGGRAALAKAKSMHMTATLSAPAQGMSGTVTVTQAAPDLIRVVTDLGGGAIKLEQGYDGKIGWSKDPIMGTRLLAPKELADVKRQGSELLRYADFETYYATLETIARLTWEGKDAYKVRMVPKEGSESTAYFDAETGLQVGIEATQETPLGPIPATLLLSDYRTFGGIKVPGTITTRAMGVEMLLVTTDVQWNPKSLPAFTAPPDVLALLRPAAPPAGSQ